MKDFFPVPFEKGQDKKGKNELRTLPIVKIVNQFCSRFSDKNIVSDPLQRAYQT